MSSQLLVFSDLDGSLLDHYSYSFEVAREQLEALRRAAVPVILASSKTRAEIEPLRAALENGHPFIVENGAAVFIPEGYFAEPPADTHRAAPADTHIADTHIAPADTHIAEAPSADTHRRTPGRTPVDTHKPPAPPADTHIAGDYRVRQWVPPRAHWLELLARLEADYGGEFVSFHGAGNDGIQAMTGLDPAAAALANQRDFSEPLRWLGDPVRKAAFVAQLQAAGATVQQGGRFLAVAGDCDKGRALRWLRDIYAAQEPARDVHDIAIGDSHNDCPMLEAAETALLIRSPVHPFPTLQRSEGVWRSRACGPAGWAEGVDRWLQRYHIATKE